MSVPKSKRTITLMACGDVGPVHPPLRPYSDLVRDVLAEADIRFAQCERVYSNSGVLQVHSAGRHSRLDPTFASVFDDCGFDVVSVASNHSVDWGPDALLESVEVLRSRGIQTIGVGRDLVEACAPAVVQRKGVKVAFLGFCSVLRDGYAAGPSTPGVAPMRAHTYYRAREYQAGVPPIVVTTPYPKDLANLVECVKDARRVANVVVVSLHWGLHFIPRAIADYQTIVAEAAFDAGADLLIGHHAHVPKAVATIGGKVCFFSLSNFIMTAPSAAERPGYAQKFRDAYGFDLDPDYPRLPYGPDGKRTLISKVSMSTSGVERVAFLPALIDTELRPEVLNAADPRFKEAVSFMEWVSEGFDHEFVVDGDEVVVR